MIDWILLCLLFCLLGMAKVTGPLFSISASGKLADAMVHFGWKGRAVVRRWLKPSNPQTGNQGDRRVMLGGLGRAPKYIQKDSVYYTYALAVEEAGQTWISSFVKYIMATYFVNVAGFDALEDEYFQHPTKADFISAASTLGLTTFDLTYRAMTKPFGLGFQIYCLAKYGCDQYLLDNLKFATAPYTKALDQWIGTDVTLMVADFTP